MKQIRRLAFAQKTVNRLLSELKGSDRLSDQRTQAFIAIYTHADVSILTLSKVKIGDLHLNHVPAEISIDGKIYPLNKEAAEVLTEYISYLRKSRELSEASPLFANPEDNPLSYSRLICIVNACLRKFEYGGMVKYNDLRGLHIKLRHFAPKNAGGRIP